MIRPVKTYTRISTQFGSRPDPGVFGAHAGTDYACPVGTPVYAPITGKVTQSFYGSIAGGQVEVTGDGKSHRMLHLSKRVVTAGQYVSEGQLVGYSGSTGTKTTGPHCHWDIRTAGTEWNHALSDYVDPEKYLAAANAPKPLSSSLIGKHVYLSATVDAWRVYKPGTHTVAGTLKPKANGGLVYLIRGIDSLPNRVLVNSAAFGSPVSLPIDSDATIK